jgi:CRISPR-associated protein Cmr4
MPTSDFYLLTAISNLHAGSGEGDFSIIDKQVQRDSITNFPVMHASGVKGALREAAELPSRNILTTTIQTVFGSKPDDKLSLQGLYQFHDAKMLCLPLRSSHSLFFRATCPAIIKEMLRDLELLGLTLSDAVKNTLNALSALSPTPDHPLYITTNEQPGLQLEDWTATHQAPPAGCDLATAKLIFGERLALLHNNDFAAACEALPVIARNYLENGISQNLWYEEVVPRESRFYFSVIRPDDSTLLTEIFTALNHRAQFGANATVGYGLCQISNLV